MQVTPVGNRCFRLEPYPFDSPELRFNLPARFVAGSHFRTPEILQEAFASARVQQVSIALTAG